MAERLPVCASGDSPKGAGLSSRAARTVSCLCESVLDRAAAPAGVANGGLAIGEKKASSDLWVGIVFSSAGYPSPG